MLAQKYAKMSLSENILGGAILIKRIQQPFHLRLHIHFSKCTMQIECGGVVMLC